MNPTIGFAGMTHLGLNSAVAAAEKGFNVVGFDLSVSLISELNEGQLPVSEPQLDTMLKSNQMRLHFTAKLKSSANVTWCTSHLTFPLITPVKVI